MLVILYKILEAVHYLLVSWTEIPRLIRERLDAGRVWLRLQNFIVIDFEAY